jgi:hypothetical protein
VSRHSTHCLLIAFAARALRRGMSGSKPIGIVGQIFPRHERPRVASETFDFAPFDVLFSVAELSLEGCHDQGL